LYLEVGSGTSTLVARRAIDDYMLRTKIVSIDPAPRRTVDAACDEVLRTPFETADLSVFNQLSSGDIVFIDNSHRALMNSDVTVFFLEVLPNLPSGVLVHLHDIFLPYDYPPVMSRRAYAEQYLLATAMLCGQTLFEVMHPGQYVIRDPELSQTTHSVWSRPELAAVQLDGGSFWLRIL
jgi:hypothetical protein